MDISKLFAAGGVVMYPLLLASILVVTLAIERLYFWFKIGRRQQPLIQTVLDLYQHRSPLVIDRLDLDRDLPIARIFHAAIALKDTTPDEFRLALESEAHQEIPSLRRFNNVFDAVISLAPLLGLLGTILGLIESFSALNIGTGGNTNTPAIAGIGMALIATASGLVVAIVASICANLFRGLYQRQLAQIQASTSQLELLHRRQWEDRKGSLDETLLDFTQ
ncbi:MotA/TolQ/ExbB proton channel family protein [Chamaesiphon sp. OTE_75_metabat_556]|uniref:MotA/TolQ/ExbB proton channel family protein n=1 Tax=Chamaesiphon sp. OTE_75_metabat_556 TaxID=2964692 RepID=UPI00286B4BF8|nr:MotA/TolQ/ExbB proton channel family protein [Chamaesiphon sp. OTE_75_metabat_556]